jgi:hypothetical protein
MPFESLYPKGFQVNRLEIKFARRSFFVLGMIVACPLVFCLKS